MELLSILLILRGLLVGVSTIQSLGLTAILQDAEMHYEHEVIAEIGCCMNNLNDTVNEVLVCS